MKIEGGWGRGGDWKVWKRGEDGKGIRRELKVEMGR